MAQDSVFIEGLRLVGKHGVHDWEREAEQEFVIDIRASIDAATAARSDDLQDTVDYSQFAATAKNVVEAESFYLIERVAETICSKILADTKIQAVEVTVRKPEALKNGVPGVTIVRSRVL